MSSFSTLGRFSIALAAGLSSIAAQADNPVNGALLYANQCASCHGNSPLTSNGSKIYNGAKCAGRDRLGHRGQHRRHGLVAVDLPERRQRPGRPGRLPGADADVVDLTFPYDSGEVWFGSTTCLPFQPTGA